jgi:putative heme-binding domain-containing protein
MLSNAHFEALSPAARKLLDARETPQLQRESIRAMSDSSDPRVGQILLEGWTSRTPTLRDFTMEVLFARQNRLPALIDALEQKQIRWDDLSRMQREQLTKTAPTEIASRATKLSMAAPNAPDQAELRDKYLQALGGVRDVDRGRIVFTKTCLPCHKLNGEGFEVGPPLESVIAKPDEGILLDLLDPSGHIEPEYMTYTVVTSDGRTFNGILTSESATSVSLQKEKGVREVILRQDIDELKASAVSLMPANLHEQISPVDAAHLIGFLRATFSSPRGSGTAP